MLYGVADEPLNLTTTSLMSMQVPFATIFEHFTQNHPWYCLKELAPDLPRTTKNLPRTRSEKK